jgi:hypothetical protein
MPWFFYYWQSENFLTAYRRSPYFSHLSMFHYFVQILGKYTSSYNVIIQPVNKMRYNLLAFGEFMKAIEYKCLYYEQAIGLQLAEFSYQILQ